uniref:Uncharacterized protein n=1 Tax=Romanomermis culicivorax TaxID=13658 RepID=A0A915L741_ROMCU
SGSEDLLYTDQPDDYSFLHPGPDPEWIRSIHSIRGTGALGNNYSVDKDVRGIGTFGKSGTSGKRDVREIRTSTTLGNAPVK